VPQSLVLQPVVLLVIVSTAPATAAFLPTSGPPLLTHVLFALLEPGAEESKTPPASTAQLQDV